MASTFTTVQFMDPPGGPGVTGAVKAGSGIIISADGTISTQQGGGIVKTITGTNGVTTAGTTDVIVSLNPPTSATIGGVRTVDGSGISIDSQGVIRSVAQFSILAGTGISVTNVTPISSTVSVSPAGLTSSTRGGVWLDADSGLSVSFSGALAVTPATTTKLGGVKVGNGLSITPDGVLTTAGAIGTITNVIAGVGLSGGGTSGAVTLNMLPPTATVIGGVKAGSNIIIDPDGTINAQTLSSVASVSGVSPVAIAGTPSNPVVTVQAASTTSPGVSQLFDGVNSTLTSLAATANSVRLAYTEAVSKLPLAGGTLTGSLTVNSGGSPGSSALTVSGGSLTLSSQFTPPSSSSTGTVGQIAWDNSGYLYLCYAPNTWGRVQIDLTPF